MAIKLPKRKHIGCDPMCEECTEWMECVLEKTRPVTAEAIKAFWNVVEAMLPEVTPNLLYGGAERDMRDFCEEAVMHWAVNNLPEPKKSVAKAENKVIRFQPNARHNEPTAIWKS